jgi:transaldolase/glucose-6-phosphate isomerase
MAPSPLQQVYALGQSIWYDNIRRGLLTSGELQRLIENDAVVGVTSNPTIFEKAIDGSADYDAAIRGLVGQGVTDPKQIVEALAVEDVQAAADLLRPVYDRTHGGDGYVSIEVAPTSAHDTKATIAEARSLWERVNRPNVMIKIPATPEGLPAIEQMIYEGVNVNVTLIFSLDVYQQVTEAYIRGLEYRHQEDLPVTGVASVASFFVSRVDTAVDGLLEQRAGAVEGRQRDQIHALEGKAAIANAKLAYRLYKQIFHGQRFVALAGAGAQPQRCLWASTSAKNPAYSDVLYAESLIGPETVDTMPPQTIVAFEHHGRARLTLEDDVAAADETMRRLAGLGIDMRAVTEQLEVEGVQSFADSYTKLIESTRQKIERLRAAPVTAGAVGGSPQDSATTLARGGGLAGIGAVQTQTPAQTSAQMSAQAPNLAQRQQASLGPYQRDVDAALDRADAEHFAQRVWKKDASLWQASPDQQGEIVNRLGWLSVIEQMTDGLSRLDDLRDDVRSSGFTHCLLLGAGGASLAAEALRATFGSAPGQPEVFVLDTTDPATILTVERAIPLPRTLFVVASKSGATLETLALFRYFYEKVRASLPDNAPEPAGSQFIAITDPGTRLDQLARDNRFRVVYRNPADIGGRYGALSYFGLAPAAIQGVDLKTLLDRAETMAHACAPTCPVRENPGAWLGATLAALALRGRDKVTLVLSPPLAALGYWLEQLLAASTGKDDTGIVPIEGETLGSPAVYGSDRVFVYIRADEGFDPAQDEAVARLEAAGQLVVRLALRDRYDLGQEFFRWQFATAIAGAFLGVNPFNQPNLQEAKESVERLLQEYTRTRALPQPRAILQTETRNVSIVAEGEQESRIRGAISLQAALESFLTQARPGDYCAVLAYVTDLAETEAALQQLRLRLRDSLDVATTLGYGPRAEHATGQLHKGGPNIGIFIQFVATDAPDAPIPGAPYTFGVLKQAQALADLRALEAHARRVIRIDLGANIAGSLSELQQALDAAQVQAGV